MKIGLENQESAPLYQSFAKKILSKVNNSRNMNVSRLLETKTPKRHSINLRCPNNFWGVFNISSIQNSFLSRGYMSVSHLGIRIQNSDFLMK